MFRSILFLTLAIASPCQASESPYSWPAQVSPYEFPSEVLTPPPAVTAAKPETPKPPIDPRPIVWFYISPPGEKCPPCDALEAAAKTWKNAPFQLLNAQDNPDLEVWPWITDEFPVTRWKAANGQWLAITGWHGKAHLETEWRKTMAPPKPPAATPRARYPTRSEFRWTGPDGVNPLANKEQAVEHLLNHEGHGRRFVREFLLQMSLSELRALHSDDHDRRVQWAAIRPNLEKSE